MLMQPIFQDKSNYLNFLHIQMIHRPNWSG